MDGVEQGTPLWRQILNGVNIGVIALCVLFVLSVASLVSSSYNPFIYFNF